MLNNKSFIPLFMGFFLVGCLFGCRMKDTNTMTSKLTDEKLQGIWIMSDTEKMSEFLNTGETAKGPYCLEFHPQDGRAKVQFLYSAKIYNLEVIKVSRDEYKFIRADKFRIAKFEEDRASDEDTFYYWRFSDSSPYDPNNPGKRDGTKTSKMKTLSDSIEAQQKEYEFRERPDTTPGANIFQKRREQMAKEANGKKK